MRIRYLVMALIVPVIFLLSSCNSKQKSTEVKIGAILPLTGPLSYLGEEEKKALELAVSHLNAQNKVVSIVFEDSKGKPAEAATAANKLIDIDKVDALITSTTSVSRAVLPIADRNKKLIAALCLDPTIQKESPYAFRLYQSMGAEAEILLNYYGSKKNKSEKIGVLYVNHAGTVQQLNDYFVPGFERIGSNVSYKESYELSDKDFRSKIDKIRKSEIESLIIIGFGFEYGNIFQQLAQNALIGKIEISGAWGFIAPNNVPKDLLENIVVATPEYVFSKNEKAKKFETDFISKFAKEPNFDAAFAYDAIGIIVNGFLKANGNAAKIHEELKKIGTYNGIMGQSIIDTDGGLSVPMSLGIIKAGKIIQLKK